MHTQIDIEAAFTLKLTWSSAAKNSKINVEMVPTMPTNRFKQISTMYAVLGTSKINDAGYIRGVIAQLEKAINQMSPDNQTFVVIELF